MIAIRSLCLAILVAGTGLVLASGTVRAAEVCYRGDAGSGALEFHGAVEGSGFSGHFDEFRVEYCIPDAGPEAGTIRVVVETGSADTDNPDRDGELHGEDFFQVSDHPRATWTSTAIRPTDDGYAADGELEIRDIRNPQSVRFTLEPAGESLRTVCRFRMRGRAEVNRQDFGVGRGEFADPEFVRNRVDVTFDLTLKARN